MFLEGAPATEQASILLNELILRLSELGRARLAVELVQQRLGMKGIEVARSTGHEEEHNCPRLGAGSMRRLRRQGVGAGAEALLVDERGQGQRAEAAKGIAEERATGRNEE